MRAAGSKQIHKVSGASARLFSMVTWTCAICGNKRPDAEIGSEFYDIGIRFGVRPGIVGVNVRYCKDDPECVRKAKEKYPGGGCHPSELRNGTR
jgi:hypothetical protein